MSSGKAPGSDPILAQVYSAGGPLLIGKLNKMYQTICNKGKVQLVFKDALIVHLYKWKGNRWACDNHRGIFLLSIAGKILAVILQNHLNQHLKVDLLPDSVWILSGP